jgi:hypothetical protein
VADAITQAFTPPAPHRSRRRQEPGRSRTHPARPGRRRLKASGRMVCPPGLHRDRPACPPGGRPDIQTLIAGMRGNSPR